jgi:hypothetical protein
LFRSLSYYFFPVIVITISDLNRKPQNECHIEISKHGMEI